MALSQTRSEFSSTGWRTRFSGVVALPAETGHGVRLAAFAVGAACATLLCGCEAPGDDQCEGYGSRYGSCSTYAGHTGVAGASNGGDRGSAAGSKSPKRNVIIMIGDGMPLISEVAASRYLTGTDFGLYFQSFPTVTYKTTWDVNVYDARAATLGGIPSYDAATFVPSVGYDPTIGGSKPYPLHDDTAESLAYFSAGDWTIFPDSASTATAMATGLKTASANISWGAPGSGRGALQTSAELLREQYGMAVGFVTTVPFSHATPAGFFAHNPSRGAAVAIGNEILNVTRPDVVIGGAWEDVNYYDPADLDRALDSDDWEFVHLQAGIDSNDALLAASVRANQSNKRLLGIFGGGDRPAFLAPVPANDPDQPKVDASALDRPTLSNSSIAALEVLSRDPDGFFALIEQGHIDWANHNGDFNAMIGGVWELDEAVRAVSKFVERPGDDIDWSNTTLLITADHSNGYMRFAQSLGKGVLPNEVIDAGTPTYPDSEVSFNSAGHHTSEMVSVYVKGFAAEKIHEYENVYPGARIIDDTSIYKLTLDATRR